MLRSIVISVSLLSALLIAVFHLSAAQASSGTIEPSSVTISTNKAANLVGETVHVTGQIGYPLDLNNLLRIMVFTPSGQTFRIDEFKINSDGCFT